ncbi:sel1 repeat family protein [Rahnella woolbedingensis]|uniref:Sel1 repeat family protein n=2 Tax=Rahnella woolbedingensis TaxID=1510574 RepID=A0A419NAJ2_9GAMM|nr:sel1 repeat family protein [Rahnella woolbedingensis]
MVRCIKGNANPKFRRWALLSCLLLAACDQSSIQTTVSEEPALNPLSDINANLAFTCKHETIPAGSADTDVLFKYARWLQKNNQLKQDPAVDTETERLYRIAAENGHYKATINLQNGSLRGQFSLTAAEHLRFSHQLIKANVATGYYFTAIYLQNGVAGLKQDAELALRYYRKAADEGNPQAQAYVGEKLAPGNMAPDISQQMRYCAAEQGEGMAARYLGVTLQSEELFKQAIEVFQLGVAAGDENAASFLFNGFAGPEPTNTLYYLGQQKDPERARRYKAILKILSDYSYAHPTVPEINDIVPLPPAPLPAWDGKLKWLEEREANIPPTKPSEALIEKLAKDKQLNPETGRPLPTSPDFDKSASVNLLCKTGEACPKSGYWQIAWLPHEGISQNAIIAFREGDIMPTDRVEICRSRPWPLSDKLFHQDQHVDWRFVGEA